MSVETKNINWIGPQMVSEICVAICKKCGALVTAAYTEDHEMWHEKLRRAVDEAEMLG